MRDLSDLAADDDGDDMQAAPATIVQDLAFAVVMAALPRSIRRRLDRGEAVAILISVPGNDWVAPVSAALKRRWTFLLDIARDGTSRSEHKPDRGNDLGADALVKGRPVAGVSQDPHRFLPASLVACADAHVVVQRPDAAVLRRLLKRHSEAPVPRSVPDTCAALSFNDIVSCFRARSTARDVLGRLARAADRKSRGTSDDNTPPLSGLPGYSGAPRQFADNLVAAYAAWRADGQPWSSVPAAAIFSGPPGTGKSTLAKAIARSLGVPLVATSVGQWLSIGEGHLGDACRMASQNLTPKGPSLILVDELDALPDRARLSDRAAEWWTTLVTHVCLLTDTLRATPGVALIACSNHVARIDGAILRRFSRIVSVDLPTKTDLQAIIKHHAGGDLLDADLAALCRMAPDASAADAARWVMDARNAARAAGRDLAVADIAAVIMPPDTRPRDLVARIARHEAAHAVVGDALGVQRLGSVSLCAPGAEGVARFELPSGPVTRDAVDALVVNCLAGRAADILWGGGAQAGSGGGPGSDAFQATRLLAAARVSWALGDAPPLCVGTADDALAMLRADPALRRSVETDLARLDARARTLVAEHATAIERVARALVARRWLSGEAVRAIVARAGRAGKGSAR